MTYNQIEPIDRPGNSSDIESDEGAAGSILSKSTLFAQTFRLNAWFFVALFFCSKVIWGGMLFPRVQYEGVIWATQDFGLYLRSCYLRALVYI